MGCEVSSRIVFYEGLGPMRYLERLLIEPMKKRYRFEAYGYKWTEKGPPKVFDGAIIVIGHSFGGATALKFAKEYKGEIEAVITLDPRAFPLGFPLGGFKAPLGVSTWNFYQTFPLRGYLVEGANNTRVAMWHPSVPGRAEVHRCLAKYL